MRSGSRARAREAFALRFCLVAATLALGAVAFGLLSASDALAQRNAFSPRALTEPPRDALADERRQPL